MLNDIILFAKLAETNLASYGSRLKGMCEGIKVNTVIELLRLYYTDSISDRIPYCGWTMKCSFEMFCSDILNMTEEEQEEMTEQIIRLRLENPLKRTYIIPRKISAWVEEIYQGFIRDYPSERIRQKFLAMYCNADRFYDSILFHPEKAFYSDIDPDVEVVKEIWQFTIYVAQFLTDNILKNKQLTKADGFRRKCEEFVENLHICHLEAYNRLNYRLAGTYGQRLIQDDYNLRVSVQEEEIRQLLATPESMSRIIFGHPEMVWNTFEPLASLDHKTLGILKKNFEGLYTFIADLARQLPTENEKQYLRQMFEFLEPYQEDRVMEYIRDNDNTPILYLILAYVRSRPTGSYMDVLARFNGFFSSEQTIEQIASSLGARRNKIVALFQNPEPDKTLRRIASYPEAKRYNLTKGDWIDLTDPKSLMDDQERALVEKLNATDEALYYALSTLCQVQLVPILDRMIGIAPDLLEKMDFAGAINSLWKTKFKFSETPRVVNIPETVSMHLQVPGEDVNSDDMERIERVFIALVRLIMPDLQLGYPNIIIPESKVNAEAELFRFVSLMKEITVANLLDIFTSNYPQFNIRRAESLIPIIELSGKIGYSPRKRKFMPRGPKTVKYPYDHLKDSAIEDRSWLKYQDINGVDEPQTQMPSQGTKSLTYEQITTAKVEEKAPKAAPKIKEIKESADIRSALQAALAISARLTDVDSIVETSTEYDSDSVENGELQETQSSPIAIAQEGRVVSFDPEKPASLAHEAHSVDELTLELAKSSQFDSHAVDEHLFKPEDNAEEPTTKEEPDIADILEDFGTHTQSEEPLSEEKNKQPIVEETNIGVEKTSIVTEEAIAEEPTKAIEEPSLFDEVPKAEQTAQVVEEEVVEESQDAVCEESQSVVTEQSNTEVEERQIESIVEDFPVREEVSEPIEEETIEPILDGDEVSLSDDNIVPIVEETNSPIVEVLEDTTQPIVNETSIPKVEETELTPDVEQAPATIEEQPQVLAQEQVELANVASQSEETAQPKNKEVVFDSVEESKEVTPQEHAQAEAPSFVTEKPEVAPQAVSIVSEESDTKPSNSTGSAKSKKNTKDIVVVTEPQAEMSPYRQSLVIEEKKAEEEKKEKEKGKRGRKPLPKPSPDLPLKENIIRVLRNSKAPMTLPNIVKSLRKAGVNPEEDDVADIIYKFDKEEFLFFMMSFIGLMEKKYNFNLYRLDSKNSQTFEYMGRAFFAFCDRNGRMPFMDEEEERFLDRWVSHLLDEKVKCTPQQMKWFRQEVIRRRGKVLNKEEWTFAENCQQYKKFFNEHKTHPNPNTDARLYRWFARASQNYKTLNAIKRSEFDSLVEYLDQFSLFGMFD